LPPRRALKSFAAHCTASHGLSLTYVFTTSYEES